MYQKGLGAEGGELKHFTIIVVRLELGRDSNK